MASREVMVNWAKDNVYRWIDMDGMYGAQCVDLTMAYVLNFANFKMFGNAIDYMNNPIPPNWTRYRKGEDSILPGDIAIWQWGSWDKFGHVGIVIEVVDNLITSVEQNVDGTPERGGMARIMTREDTCLIGFIRPHYDNNEEWQRISEYGTFTVEVTSINVRSKPSTLGKIVANYAEGETVNYDSYVINEGFIWISYISYSNERRYLATGTCKDNKRTSSWGSFS
ncbi:CHAP domain-containing protein [Gemella cuniculi]|uniref:CHAP domain-containing protein n=1 Tax=Gemella cuniculi TaxID=150240 RepID=UPI000428616D|nr:CHAP domain-containing protein [Gemella cuniculi]